MRRWYVGLSSGSSLCGIDAALVQVDGVGADLTLRLAHHVHWPYGKELRELLWRAKGEEAVSARTLGVLHRVLGEAFAAAVRLLGEQTQGALAQVLAIGCSGHPFWHDPEGRYPSTLSLGMMAALAERTGLTTVSDFRSRDVVLGGQGCPLTPLIDQRLFHHAQEQRVLVHLGGMVTLVWLPGDVGPGLRQVLAFQAAPGTLLLDGLMRLLTGGREPFDPGGKYAVQGRCIDTLLARWLAHPALQRRPPKCVPASEFGSDFLNHAVRLAREEGHSLHDVLCTATHFVARAVAEAIARELPVPATRVLLSGGGVRNGLLWRLLEQHLGPVPLERLDAHGVPAEARKAVAYAGLAALTMDGQPANLPAATGAAGPRLLGQLTPGSSGNWARCLAWMAAQTAPLRLAAA